MAVNAMPVEVSAGPERSRLCESILRQRPEWFGIASAVAEYVNNVAELPTFAVGDDAFLSLKQHSAYAAEIYVMGVRPERHRQGLGRALVAAAEQYLQGLGVEYLQVKTLGSSHPSRGYAATRRFYDALGFRPLEEIHGLWAEGNPCLLLVKRLG
jgi:GNAT superfamily N-acetyltransferase